MANNNNNKKNTLYEVKNRSASTVIYKIPERNIRREFAPGETKKIPFWELEELTWQAGGRELMANFLQITEEKVIDNLNIPVENEYFMNEEQIVELLKTGSLAAFLDCLDFAPIGVIDLVKELSVALPLTDTQKIGALKEKTGFDVEAAIRNAAADKAPETEEEEKPAAKQTKSTGSTGRRTNTQYKVVKPKTAE